MSWILCDLVFGAHERSQALEISRAPSFCRAEGAFLSVESPQVCLCYIFTAKRSIFIYKDYELFKSIQGMVFKKLFSDFFGP